MKIKRNILSKKNVLSGQDKNIYQFIKFYYNLFDIIRKCLLFSYRNLVIFKLKIGC